MRNIISITILILSATTGFSQDGSLIANTKTANLNVEIKAPIFGLWEVTEVTVGQEVLTPTAKWFEINEDGTITSGNGWLQNASDTWEYDELTKEILFLTNGVPDEYGGFIMANTDTQMTWQRMEEGEPVIVTLKKVDKKPLAPWDKILGTWKTEVNAEAPRTVTFQWTRGFIDQDDKLRMFGIWHIAAHRPVLTLFYDRDEKHIWNIEIDGNKMVWTKEENGEVDTVTFQRNN